MRDQLSFLIYLNLGSAEGYCSPNDTYSRSFQERTPIQEGVLAK
jgi:hypothetical protein